MKRICVLFLLCSLLIFSACSAEKKAESTDSTRTKLQTSSSSKKKELVTLNTILKKFTKDDLTVDEAKPMTKDDFGMAPMSAKEAKLFGIQKDASGNHMNARIFLFEEEKDLNKTKDYYDNLGKESAMAFSYTASSVEKLVLMQFNGNLPSDLVQKYADSAGLKLTTFNFTNSSDSEGSSIAENDNSIATEVTKSSDPQVLGYGDHNANIRDARYQEAIEKGATEEKATTFANGGESTYIPKSPDLAAESKSSNAQQDADALSLTDFVNKYGMSPAAWKVQNGMSEEEALKSTQNLSSGEMQLAFSKYGIRK